MAHRNVCPNGRPIHCEDAVLFPNVQPLGGGVERRQLERRTLPRASPSGDGTPAVFSIRRQNDVSAAPPFPRELLWERSQTPCELHRNGLQGVLQVLPACQIWVTLLVWAA